MSRTKKACVFRSFAVLRNGTRPRLPCLEGAHRAVVAVPESALLLADVAMPALESLYDSLGLVRTVDTDEINKAFRKLSLKYHPERASLPKAEAEALFAKIAEAY